MNSLSRTNCLKDADYQFTGCLLGYIQRKTGCEDWRTCANFTSYREQLTWTQNVAIEKVQEESGCLPRCTFTKYQFVQSSQVEVVWSRAWVSSFYLDTGTSYQEVTESYRYNAETVMGDFGSYLGLFLGWSILSLAGDSLTSSVPDGLATLLGRLATRQIETK